MAGPEQHPQVQCFWMYHQSVSREAVGGDPFPLQNVKDPFLAARGGCLSISKGLLPVMSRWESDHPYQPRCPLFNPLVILHHPLSLPVDPFTIILLLLLLLFAPSLFFLLLILFASITTLVTFPIITITLDTHVSLHSHSRHCA